MLSWTVLLNLAEKKCLLHLNISIHFSTISTREGTNLSWGFCLRSCRVMLLGKHQVLEEKLHVKSFPCELQSDGRFENSTVSSCSDTLLSKQSLFYSTSMRGKCRAQGPCVSVLFTTQTLKKFWSYFVRVFKQQKIKHILVNHGLNTGSWCPKIFGMWGLKSQDVFKTLHNWNVLRLKYFMSVPIRNCKQYCKRLPLFGFVFFYAE